MGDKTWAALFDNAKLKRVAGDFAAACELGDVLRTRSPTSRRVCQSHRRPTFPRRITVGIW
jgi:hypothetical protein